MEIVSVTKDYIGNNFMNSYQVVYNNGETWSVPHDELNTKYQEILEWVAEGNTITDNGGSE